MDIAVDAIQELCTKTAELLMQFGNKGEDVMTSKESLGKFSKYISQIKILLLELKARSVEGTTDSGPTTTTLQNLDSQLRNACKLIEKNLSGSKVRLLLNSGSMLSEMEKSAKEIAETVSHLGACNLDGHLSLKSEIDQIVEDLNALEFKLAAKTEAIMMEIEKTMTHNGRNRDHTIKLLHQIAEAVGVEPNILLARNELEQLKREKEEFEAQKKKAEAFQLSQLIQFLYSSEMVQDPQNERPVINCHDPVASFKCPLCREVMEEPVAIFCGHSFERRAIHQYFLTEKTCPTCKSELSSLELTPNTTLRNSIQEWKQKNMEKKLQNAIVGVSSDNLDLQNEALQDLQILLEMPHYRAKFTEEGLIPKIVGSLNTSGINTKAALKCLCYLAHHSDNNKEVIAEAGAIQPIVKQFYKGNADPDAIAVLMELSENEKLVEKIGNVKRCIPFLVTMLQNPNPDVSRKAQKVVQNLSSNIHLVIKMAEAGHFEPFLIRFHQEPLETQASMANSLVKMQFSDNTVKVFEEKEFVSSVIRLLSSSSPAYKSACLQCIRKLSDYPNIAKQFLEETRTIPALIRTISFSSSDQYCKQVATEILASLVCSTQQSNFKTNTNLQEIQSQHNISFFLNLAEESTPPIKAQVLCLLLSICKTSEAARNIIRSNNAAMAHLFCCLEVGHPEVSRYALKLIYAIAEDHPSGIPLLPSSAKEASVNALIKILTSSQDIEQRSVAAGIISWLPSDDTTVDEILRKSEALKAIQEVICTMDDESHKAHATPNGSLLENALAALLRYTEPTKPELQRQLRELELYPSLVRVLSRGSSLAKQRTAMALVHLSHSNSRATKPVNVETSRLQLLSIRLLSTMSWCCCANGTNDYRACSIHGSACSSKDTFCLVKAKAVRPLIQTLRETESGAAEAALEALDTMLEDPATRSLAVKAIVENDGIGGILIVLEKGPLAAKDKALDLFKKIFEQSHTQITNPQSRRLRGVLIHLLQNEDLKKKVALVLSQMEIIPKQSSYF